MDGWMDAGMRSTLLKALSCCCHLLQAKGHRSRLSAQAAGAAGSLHEASVLL